MMQLYKSLSFAQASLQALLQPSAIEIFEAVRSLFLQVRIQNWKHIIYMHTHIIAARVKCECECEIHAEKSAATHRLCHTL